MIKNYEPDDDDDYSWGDSFYDDMMEVNEDWCTGEESD